MTTPTARSSRNATAKKDAVSTDGNTVDLGTAPEIVKDNTVATEKIRIPSLLSESPIFNNFCERYLATVDKIASYNKDVFADKDSEWNPSKVLVKARELASPENANDIKPEIKAALDAWESAVTEAANRRRAVIEATAKELGITLSNTSERNPETEAPLKEERKIANTIGSQLSTMGELSNDSNFTDAISSFLMHNPLPQVGRDQVSTFGETGKTTPKYRVHITVTNGDGEELISEDGFTRTALALTKPNCGYERGKALDANALRNAWEKAGNSPENTVKPEVEFTDNNLLFKITKK